MSGVTDALRAVSRALLGVSGYQRPEVPGQYGPELDSPTVDEIRRNLGGQLQPIPETKLRWYLADLETAQWQADAGNLAMVGQLWRAMKRDGVIRGLLGTRTSGLIRLPKKFYGDDREMADELSKANGTRPLFDDMCPPSELSLMVADGIGPGASICELVPVPGRDYPVLVRLDPEYLIYRWDRNMWFYSSIAGLLPIEPGNGRWVLHVPGGRIAPWNSGVWAACGRSFINKEHAIMHRSNYSAKLANPARVAIAPQASTDAEQQSWFRKVMAWGTNTVFGLKPGYDVKLLESNGRGFEVWQAEIDTSNTELMVAIVGQIVSTTGGAGFSSQELPLQGLSDLQGETGDALAYTVNTQILPPWVANRYGVAALPRGPLARWDTSKPKDRKQVADGLLALGNALNALDDALERHDREIKIDTIAEDFGLPLLPIDDPEQRARLRDQSGDEEEAVATRATKGQEVDPKDLQRAA